jgi:hypothetical protein
MDFQEPDKLLKQGIGFVAFLIINTIGERLVSFDGNAGNPRIMFGLQIWQNAVAVSRPDKGEGYGNVIAVVKLRRRIAGFQLPLESEDGCGKLCYSTEDGFFLVQIPESHGRFFSKGMSGRYSTAHICVKQMEVIQSGGILQILLISEGQIQRVLQQKVYQPLVGQNPQVRVELGKALPAAFQNQSKEIQIGAVAAAQGKGGHIGICVVLDV